MFKSPLPVCRQRAFCYDPLMNIELIDTHCHLDFPVFDEDRDDVVSDAKAASVNAFVVPGVVAQDWPRLLECCAEFGFSPALGLHPCFIDQHQDADLERLEVLLASEKVVAVGEIGLDFFIADPNQSRQMALFDAQLELAKRFNLPVLLHVRKAHDQVLKLLRHKKLSSAGIVHAYSGSEQQATQYADLGFKLGIGGSLTYDRAKKLRRIATEMPLSTLVLETDSPDIPLLKHRGIPNQPKRVREVAEVLAGLRGISLEELAHATSTTARKLLNL